MEPGAIRHARKLSATRSQHKYAFHSVIVQRGGATVATGYNHGEIHAEVNALGKLWPDHREGTKLWSIRVTPGGKLASAKPCNNCETYLRKYGVKLVIYSNAEGTLTRMKL